MRTQRRSRCLVKALVISGVVGGLVGVAATPSARADFVNIAEGAPISCANFDPDECIKINDGSRTIYGQSSGYKADNRATVDVILPDGAYVTELYWHTMALITWGGEESKLEIQEVGGGPWVEIDDGPGGFGGGTVPLDPPRPISRARIWANSGNHSLFGSVYRFYELEVWAVTLEPLPDDYFYGYARYVGYDADPVNTATGNFTHEETDLSIAIRGDVPFGFSRFYNAKDAGSGPLGPGWRHSYYIWIDPNVPDDQVAVHWSDGRTDYWTDDGQGGYEPTYAGLYDELVHNGDSTWTVTRRNLDAYQFDANGRLTSIADKNGNLTVLAYDDLGFPDLVTGITDPAGRVLTLSYDPNTGLLQSVTDFAVPPRVTEYSYTTSRLTQVTDVLGNTIGYEYDGNGYLETITDQRGVTTVTNVYDAEGRVTDQQDGRSNSTTFEYDTPAENQTRITRTVTVEGEPGPRTLQTVHTHEGQHNLLVSIDNPEGNTVAYGYDDDNNRTSITDRNENTAQFQYDTRGNVTSTTEPDDPNDPHDGGITTAEYTDPNLLDPPTRAVDALGSMTEWTYDANGNTLTKTRWLDPNQTTLVQRSWTYNTLGQRLTETDERGNIHEWIYHADGLLIEKRDWDYSDPNAIASQTWYGYDELWRRIWVTDGRGSGPEDPAYTTYYAYDEADRLIKIEGPPVASDPNGTVQEFGYDNVGNRTSVTDGRGNTTQYFYDNNNNLIRIEEFWDGNPQGRVTRYEYDELNRRVKMFDANHSDPNEPSMHYQHTNADWLELKEDAEGNQWTYTYDAHGNTLTETDPSGVTLTHEYDALHRRTRTYDELGNETRYEYDQLGQLTKRSDAEGYETEFQYDAVGRLICVLEADGGWTQYTYDETGNLIEIENAEEYVVSVREYSALNQLIYAEDGNGNYYEYGYDEIGNQSWVSDANGQTTSLTYDAENRLIQIDYPDGSWVACEYDSNGNRVAMTELVDPNNPSIFTYDELNRLTSSTDRFGLQVQYGYDPVGNRTSLTYPNSNVVGYTYDGANRLTAITDWLDPNLPTQYTYDGLRIETVTYPNGVIEARGYDTAGRLESLTMEDHLGTPLLSYTYVRDGVGNAAAVTETGTLQPTLAQSATGYDYDADNRLVQSSQGTYQYDNNGNLTSRTVGGVTTTFTYDYEDRLTFQTTGGSTVQHVYDGDSHRVARIENGVETRYALDRGRSMSHVLCETDPNGTITAYYIHGPTIVARIDASGQPHYYHTNDVGNVVALTDPNEQVTDQYAYTPFGLLTQQGTTPNPFTFVGGLGVMAEADDLYFMRARFYDPDTGRFLGKDPVEGVFADPGSFHRYVYAFNRPTLLVDPQGLTTGTMLEGILRFIVDAKNYEPPEEAVILLRLVFGEDFLEDKKLSEVALEVIQDFLRTKGEQFIAPAFSSRGVIAATARPGLGGALFALADVLGVAFACIEVLEIGVEGLDVLDRINHIDMSEAAKKGLKGKDLADSIMSDLLRGTRFATPAWGIEF